MLNQFKSKIILFGAATMMAAPLWAGFNVTRMTTVVDDANGSYTISSTGRLSEQQFSGNTVTEFNGFQPGGEQQAVIDGIITQAKSRGNGQLNVSADGDFSVSIKTDAWDISFTALSVLANEAGVELSGQVTANETNYDVNELPEGLAAVLRRVFWLTRR